MAANSRFAVATHIMTSLALHENEVVSSSYLASSVNTNPVVIRRILSDLQKAGLIITKSGKAGGAQLAKAPANIFLSDIYNAIEGNEVFAYNPNDPNKQCKLSCVMKGVLEPVFQSVQNALNMDLQRTSLGSLVHRINKLAPLTADEIKE